MSALACLAHVEGAIQLAFITREVRNDAAACCHCLSDSLLRMLTSVLPSHIYTPAAPVRQAPS